MIKAGKFMAWECGMVMIVAVLRNIRINSKANGNNNEIFK